MQETKVQPLDWEDPREEEMATHSSILAWKIPWQATVHGDSPWMTQHAHTHTHINVVKVIDQDNISKFLNYIFNSTEES